LDIADILFGVDSPKEDFFDIAASPVAAAVMDALNRKAGDNWTFYDLITAMRPENVEAILKSNPYGKQEYKTYFQSPTASSTDLVKTLANKTKVLRPVAYAWTHAKEHLSLTDWVNSHTKSIVLANDDDYTKPSKGISRILLNILSKKLLGKENPPARTFLYLDEFENLGHISTLTRIAH
jgi:type IV secretory pathway TraG/TraD family ATPase VirD4